jgi:hypothetical protein
MVDILLVDFVDQ